MRQISYWEAISERSVEGQASRTDARYLFITIEKSPLGRKEYRDTRTSYSIDSTPLSSFSLPFIHQRWVERAKERDVARWGRWGQRIVTGCLPINLDRVSWVADRISGRELYLSAHTRTVSKQQCPKFSKSRNWTLLQQKRGVKQ